MKFLRYTLLAIATLFAVPTFAQTADPSVPTTCDNGGSLQSFKDAAAKSKEPVLVLEGKDLETFANAIDAIIQGQHDPAINALAFKDPSTAKEGEDTTQVVIFKNGCVTGVVPFPTTIVKKALGQGV